MLQVQVSDTGVEVRAKDAAYGSYGSIQRESGPASEAEQDQKVSWTCHINNITHIIV